MTFAKASQIIDCLTYILANFYSFPGKILHEFLGSLVSVNFLEPLSDEIYLFIY